MSGISCIVEGDDTVYHLNIGIRELRLPTGYRLNIAGYENPGSVTVEKWEQPWTGKGLPPVGTVCLLRYDNGGWGEALIKYISETMCVWQWVRPEHEQQNVEWGQSPQHIEFQRIRTQEELLAEARENFIDELVQVTCIRRGEAGLIYDAGYRKVQP